MIQMRVGFDSGSEWMLVTYLIHASLTYISYFDKFVK